MNSQIWPQLPNHWAHCTEAELGQYVYMCALTLAGILAGWFSRISRFRCRTHILLSCWDFAWKWIRVISANLLTHLYKTAVTESSRNQRTSTPIIKIKTNTFINRVNVSTISNIHMWSTGTTTQQWRTCTQFISKESKLSFLITVIHFFLKKRKVLL